METINHIIFNRRAQDHSDLSGGHSEHHQSDLADERPRLCGVLWHHGKGDGLHQILSAAKR